MRRAALLGATAQASPFSPSDLSGLYAWYKADAITGLSDGAAVSSWSDSSASGFTMAQVTGTQQPLYKTSIVNSLPVVRFDGSNDVLTSSASSSLTTTTMFVVLRPSSVSGTPEILAVSAPGGLLLRLSSGGLHLVKSGVAQIANPGPTALSTSVFTVAAAAYTDTTSYALYVNGAADASGSHAQTLATGKARWIDNSTNSLAADIAEIVIYNRVVNSTERGQVTAYLGSKYAITVV